VRRVRLYRVSSVVIRQRALGEADRIITLYTRERGKVSAVAKGVRRARSKLAGGLQLFCHARMQLAAGRSLEVVTQVQPIDLFYRLREDMRRYVHASYAAELLDSLVDEEASDPALFDLLLGTYRGLDGGADPPTLTLAFQLKLLGRLGYGPELGICVLCGGEIGTGRAGFSAAQGGTVCGRCLRSHSAAAVGPEAVRAMRELAVLPTEELAKRRLTGAVREELERVLRPFVDYQLPRPLQSAEFLTA
jgi:DNA repair protein RecO (recombination protein O)